MWRGNIYDPARHHRRSIRLPDYDYAQGAAYFVTICVQGRACTLGSVVDGTMCLSAHGEIVAHCWTMLPAYFPTIVLDACVLMPNHVHAIIFLSEQTPAPEEMTPHPDQPSLGRIVGAFKSISTRQINAQQGLTGTFWQHNYYEHIVRNERSLARLQTYIAENPARWEADQLHPVAATKW